MDFDPSAFLAMNMSEEENAVYTAPDLIEPNMDNNEPMTMTVFGGLEIEQAMQIPVPVFDTLNLSDQEEEMDYGTEPTVQETSPGINELVQVDVSSLDKSSVTQNSPVQRTSSPHVKRIIPTSADESRFRKDFYCGDYKRVKLFRLHCTICDKHLGCAPRLNERQMRMHKLFNVAVCRKCFDFYGDINFPIEDNSELYCCWCGEGGEVFCCSKCPKIVCKKCITRNLGHSKVKEIEENDNWMCLVCNPVDIWPHRALFWGLQRLSKEMRQNVALLTKEDRIVKLSMDTSHCCQKLSESTPSIVLPRKSILSKVPLTLIAFAHQLAVRNQPDQRISKNVFIGSTSRAMNSSCQQTSQSVDMFAGATSQGMSNSNQRTSQNFFVPTSQAMNRFSNLSTCIAPQMVGVRVTSRNSEVPHNKVKQRKVGFQTPRRNFRVNQPMHNGSSFNRSSPYPVSRPGSHMPVRAYNASNQLRRDRLFQPVRDIPKPSQSLLHGEIIDLIEYPVPNEPMVVPQIISHDVSWLEKGMKELKETLSPITTMLDHFPLSKASLQEDFRKLTSFSDRLTYNIKIAICNLAKLNQDIMDANKSAVDTKVSNIVRDQINGLSSRSISFEKITPGVEMNVTKPKTPQMKPETLTLERTQKTVTPGKPSANTSPPVEEFNPALLCEAVLQEGNKENKNSNKPEATSMKSNVLMKTKKGRGGPRSLAKSSSKTFMSCTAASQVEVPVIDLSYEDNEENSSGVRDFCKKYNIKPCKIVLQRMKTP